MITVAVLSPIAEVVTLRRKLQSRFTTYGSQRGEAVEDAVERVSV